MAKYNICTSGEGPMHVSQVGKGLVPLTDGFFRFIPIRGKNISLFSGGGKRLGGVKISEEEEPATVLQDGEEAYVISVLRRPCHGNFVSDDYLMRKLRLEGKVIAQEPKELTSFSFSTMPATIIADNFYNGNTHRPAAVFNSPAETIGYKDSFCMGYTPVTSVDLNSLNGKIIINEARSITANSLGGKRLISMLIPTSTVPFLIEERNAKALEDVFRQEDLNQVSELNKERELAHRPNCWVKSSCISESMFELVEPEGYPKYMISTDTEGKIYQAGRVVS
jgi:hypothetical protein